MVITAIYYVVCIVYSVYKANHNIDIVVAVRFAIESKLTIIIIDTKCVISYSSLLQFTVHSFRFSHYSFGANCTCEFLLLVIRRTWHTATACTTTMFPVCYVSI